MALLGRALLALLVLALLAVLPSSASASDEPSFAVSGSVRLPLASQSPSDRRVVLTPAAASGSPRVAIPSSRGGAFSFTGLAAGTYLLEVQDLENVFAPVRVDVSAKENGRVRASNADSGDRAAYPLVLRPEQPAEYFVKRVPYDWTALLKNPMVMMMGFSVFLMVVMPKMMANMDPEELEQMRKGGISSVISGNAAGGGAVSRK